jgi:hypothetical protein
MTTTPSPNTEETEWLPMNGTLIEGNDWTTSYPEDDHLCIKILTAPPLHQKHHGIYKHYPETYECKQSSGVWTKRRGHTLITVLPKYVIQIKNKNSWTYPKIKVGSLEYTLNGSGATVGSKEWNNRISQAVETAIEHRISYIQNLLDHAAPWQAHFSQWIPDSPDEIEIKKRNFYQNHANHYLVLSAWSDSTPHIPSGMVGCYATLGGKRPTLEDPTPQAKWFLVPEAEYRTRLHNPTSTFVIDTTRHEETQDFRN